MAGWAVKAAQKSLRKLDTKENQKYLCPPSPRGLNQNKLSKNDRSGIYPEESWIDSHCDQNPFKP